MTNSLPHSRLTTAPLPLEALGVIAVRGADARKFLQGQLSQDVLALHGDRVEWAGLHNPQGRVLALLRLVPAGPTDVLCVLLRELIDDTLAGLRKYLLRAKATLTDESSVWQLEGIANDERLPAAMGSAHRDGEIILWRHANDGRVLRLSPRAPSSPAPSPPAPSPPAPSLPSPLMPPSTTDVVTTDPLNAWRLADIAAGIPEVTLRTRGEFVAQMLNLDALGGISLTKGCYTGQEVIARAHYRGRVKRRAQRFRLTDAAIPNPGDQVTLTDGRSAAVVLAATLAEGGTEILAVTQTVDGDPLALPMSYPLPE